MRPKYSVICKNCGSNENRKIGISNVIFKGVDLDVDEKFIFDIISVPAVKEILTTEWGEFLCGSDFGARTPFVGWLLPSCP